MRDSRSDFVLEPGVVLENTYEVVRSMASGGMGAVFEAHHVRLRSRRVAIKVLLDTAFASPEFVARFRREAEVCASLSHPNIVSVTDWNTLPNGAPFLVMEYLEGETLRQRLKRGPLPIDEALAVAAAVADGLTAAHLENVVHRDLKPENIYLLDTGGGTPHVKLLDFGISRITTEATLATSTDKILGTPRYMAPEQLGGVEIDAAADQFSLAAITYEMVTGEWAFPGKALQLILKALAVMPPPPIEQFNPEVEDHVAAAIYRGLAKDPTERFPAVSDFAAELTGVRGKGSARRRRETYELTKARGELRAAAEREGRVNAGDRGEPERACARRGGAWRRGVLYALVVLVSMAAALGGMLLLKKRKEPSAPVPTAAAAGATGADASPAVADGSEKRGLGEQLVPRRSDGDGSQRRKRERPHRRRRGLGPQGAEEAAETPAPPDSRESDFDEVEPAPRSGKRKPSRKFAGLTDPTDIDLAFLEVAKRHHGLLRYLEEADRGPGKDADGAEAAIRYARSIENGALDELDEICKLKLAADAKRGRNAPRREKTASTCQWPRRAPQVSRRDIEAHAESHVERSVAELEKFAGKVARKGETLVPVLTRLTSGWSSWRSEQEKTVRRLYRAAGRPFPTGALDRLDAAREEYWEAARVKARTGRKLSPGKWQEPALLSAARRHLETEGLGKGLATEVRRVVVRSPSWETSGDQRSADLQAIVSLEGREICLGVKGYVRETRGGDGSWTGDHVRFPFGLPWFTSCP